jgi:hypothetical protein
VSAERNKSQHTELLTHPTLLASWSHPQRHCYTEQLLAESTLAEPSQEALFHKGWDLLVLHEVFILISVNTTLFPTDRLAV